jgi:hypothetical protein
MWKAKAKSETIFLDTFLCSCNVIIYENELIKVDGYKMQTVFAIVNDDLRDKRYPSNLPILSTSKFCISHPHHFLLVWCLLVFAHLLSIVNQFANNFPLMFVPLTKTKDKMKHKVGNKDQTTYTVCKKQKRSNKAQKQIQ